MASKEEGLVQHCVGIRYRVVGEGNLRTIIVSLDEDVNSELEEIVMSEAASKLPFTLANFRSQSMQVEFRISAIYETFTISKIVAYIKPTATGYPI